MFSFDGKGPLYRQLFRSLRDAVLDGRLRPGERLPSTRELSASVSVSRNTVLLAYELLVAGGYASGQPGSGTYVAAGLSRSAAVLPVSAPPACPPWSGFGRRATARGAFPYREVMESKPVPFEFLYGLPPVREFPHRVWQRLVAERARLASVRALAYGPPEGSAALREAIAGYLRRARGLLADPAHIVITAGCQQALDLCARLLTCEGDRVAIEEPHYLGARAVFAANGCALEPIVVDANGVQVEALAALAPGVRLAYVTPSHQFPTGATLSLPRRLALLRWAERTGAFLLEDDYDSEFRYGDRPIEPLRSIDRGGRVIYIGTFSKVLFPSLRLGYLVLPASLVEAFRAARWLTGWGNATLEQEALAAFVAQGHLERHVRRSRARCAERRQALLEALARHLGDGVEVGGSPAGLHVLAWLRDVPPARLADVIARARAAGVGVYPVAPYFLSPPERSGLLLGYSMLSLNDIREGIRRLALAVRASARAAAAPGRLARDPAA